MTLEEAIKRLSEEKVRSERGLVDTLPRALQLGIEALKWYKGAKEDGCIRSDYFLPGETEE
jgi:hypothetical protein